MSKKTLEEELKEEFQHWDNLLETGGSDPSWPDGVNLNLIINHIIYNKQSMEASKAEAPEIYHRRTPEKLPDNFMVKAEQIYWNALAIYRLCRANEDYQYLRNLVIPMDIEKKTRIREKLEWADQVYEAIQKQDYVVLRRITEVLDFKRYRTEVEQEIEKKKADEEQISLFTMGAGLEKERR